MTRQTNSPTTHLRPLTLNEDKSNMLYSSAECQELLKMYDEFYPKIGFNLPWIAYFVVAGDQVAGSCGFVGRPQNGSVEIAYWTFREFEGRGIASFACEELIRIATQADKTVNITAKTAPEHNASTRILEKNSFVRVGTVQDEEIGDAWLWERMADHELENQNNIFRKAHN